MLHVISVSGFVEVSSPSVCLNEFQTTEYVFCLIVVSCDVYERTLGGFGMISSYGLFNRLVFDAKVTWQRDSAVFKTSASANTDTLLFIEFLCSFFGHLEIDLVFSSTYVSWSPACLIYSFILLLPCRVRSAPLYTGLFVFP